MTFRDVMDYQTLKIKSQYQIEVVNFQEEIKLSDVDKAKIDHIWLKESAERNLFNGAFLTALSFNQVQMKATFVPYKYYIAQLKDPSLKSLLNVIPVSISGLTFIGENVVFAKRSRYVTQFHNHYELAPSGGIDQECVEENHINLSNQVKKELEEELGVKPRRVKSLKFFALIYDQKLESIDLCAEIRIHPFAMHANVMEYSQIITVPASEVAEFVKIENEQFVPLSLLLLRLKKIIV